MNRQPREGWSVAAAILASLVACRAGKEKAMAAGALPDPPYFGQSPPSTLPEKFAPGVVSTDAIELNGVFTPDGREFFFTRLVDGVDTMHHAAFVGGAWIEPQPLLVFPGRAKAVAVDMSVSPDGRALYFLGQFRHEHSG